MEDPWETRYTAITSSGILTAGPLSRNILPWKGQMPQPTTLTTDNSRIRTWPRCPWTDEWMSECHRESPGIEDNKAFLGTTDGSR